MRLPVNTVIHTTLAGIEPTTFRLLVRRATSSATDAPTVQPLYSGVIMGVIVHQTRYFRCRYSLNTKQSYNTNQIQNMTLAHITCQLNHLYGMSLQCHWNLC